MNAAIRVEATKLLRSPVGVIATAAIAGGILVLVLGIMVAVRSGDTAIVAKAGGARADWAGLIGTAAQITGAGGLLGFGVVLAWLFAREFADGTITGLFALPVGRGRIAAAKLAVYALWAVAVSVGLTVGSAVLGIALGFGMPDASAQAGLARQFALGILTAALALPVAWVATAARSLLAGVATAVALVVIAEVGAIAGAGAWMPFAAPALWAMSAGSAVSALQLSVPVLVATLVAAATVWSWGRLQLDR